MTKTDLAYYAGFFDGEGCISLSPEGNGKTYTLRVVMASTDKWVLPQFQFAFGGGIYKVKRDSPNHSPTWQWQLWTRDALNFLEILYPYFRIKKPQAKLAIGFQKHKKHPGRLGLEPEYLKFEEEAKKDMTKLNHRKEIL